MSQPEPGLHQILHGLDCGQTLNLNLHFGPRQTLSMSVAPGMHIYYGHTHSMTFSVHFSQALCLDMLPGVCVLLCGIRCPRGWAETGWA